MSAVSNTIPEAEDTLEADTFDRDWERCQAECDLVRAKYKHLQSRVGYKTAVRQWGFLDDYTPEGLEHMYAKIEEDLDVRDQRRREVTAARQRRHQQRLRATGDPGDYHVEIMLPREIYWSLGGRGPTLASNIRQILLDWYWQQKPK